MSPLLTFKAFNDPGEAKYLSEVLQSNNIMNEVENDGLILDHHILGTSSHPEILLKIRQDDFERADRILLDYYANQLNDINTDYYLLGFSDEELKEVLFKSDEWGYLDRALASKILSDKGISLSDMERKEAKKERIRHLTEPLTISRITKLTAYVMLLFFPLVTLITGLYLYHNKRVLPNGKYINSFNENDRSHGKIMILLAVVFICIGFLFLLTQGRFI